MPPPLCYRPPSSSIPSPLTAYSASRQRANVFLPLSPFRLEKKEGGRRRSFPQEGRKFPSYAFSFILSLRITVIEQYKNSPEPISSEERNLFNQDH